MTQNNVTKQSEHIKEFIYVNNFAYISTLKRKYLWSVANGKYYVQNVFPFKIDIF